MKNYTSKVPATRSVSRIEQLLVDVGAFAVLNEYKDGNLTALSFQKEVNGKVIPFRIPANAEPIYLILQKKHTQTSDERLYAQAERTAWRIAHEWVQIQMSFIEMKQAEFMQLFMSHVLMPGKKPGEMITLYDHMKETGFKQIDWKG